jgi:hypothetical protein
MTKSGMQKEFLTKGMIKHFHVCVSAQNTLTATMTQSNQLSLVEGISAKALWLFGRLTVGEAKRLQTRIT